MKHQNDDKPIKLEPWELVILRKLANCREEFPPEMIDVGSLLVEVRQTNLKDFFSSLLEIIQKFQIEVESISLDDESGLTISSLKSLIEEKSPQQLGDIASDLKLFVMVSKPAKARIKANLSEKIECFIRGETWSIRQMNLNKYTFDFQRANFLNRIPAYINKYGQAFNVCSSSDFKIFGNDSRKVNFTESLLALEAEELIVINEIGLFFDEDEKENLLAGIQITPRLSEEKNLPPDSWKLIEEGAKAFVKRKGKTVFTFPSNTSNKYRYFKCLWNHYGQRVLYPEVYEYQSKLEYPHKRGKNHKINSQMRNTINKLRKEFKKNELPVKILTNRGFTLTIEE